MFAPLQGVQTPSRLGTTREPIWARATFRGGRFHSQFPHRPVLPPIHAQIVRAHLLPGLIFLYPPLLQAFFEPVMSVRFGIERVDFNVAQASIKGDCLA